MLHVGCGSVGLIWPYAALASAIQASAANRDSCSFMSTSLWVFRDRSFCGPRPMVPGAYTGKWRACMRELLCDRAIERDLHLLSGTKMTENSELLRLLTQTGDNTREEL